MIDQIIAYNKTFVEQKGYEKYLTDKYPDKKLAVLSCMDTRLTELLPAALGLKNGDAKIIKNAGGLVISAFDSAMRSLIVAIYELGVEEIMVVAHSHCGACHMSYDHFHHEMIARGVTDETLDTIRKCGINLDHWLEGFKDTPESVRKTVETIKTHPLVTCSFVTRSLIRWNHYAMPLTKNPETSRTTSTKEALSGVSNRNNSGLSATTNDYERQHRDRI